MNKKDWNIIPIKSNSKVPLIPWQEFLDNKYDGIMPENCNKGVICGRISDNLVIVDLDYRGDNKKNFKEIFSEFSKAFPTLARTYIEETPNGHHFFYRIKDEVPSRKLIQDTKDIMALERFERVTKTNYPFLLKGVDILGEGGYSLIAPSTIDGNKYFALNNYDILEIKKSTFDQIMQFFIAEKQTRNRMRRPFIDILTGEVEIEEQASLTGKPEHVYWKYTFLEAWYYLKLYPEQIFPLLEKNQPAFDEKKTLTQLNYVYFDTSKPLTSTTLYEYFPQYAIKSKNSDKKKGTKEEEEQLWITIAEEFLEKYDMITLSDTEEIMIRKGNIYTLQTEEFLKELGERIRNENVRSYNAIKTNVLNYLSDITRFDRNEFCYDKWIINFKNGYYDIMVNKFYDNKYYKDKIFPYEIPHELSQIKEDCPTFKKILNEWLDPNGPITEKDIFEMMGYTMTMNTNLKTAFFIYGDQNSGKTTFQNIFEYIIGEQNRSAISLQRMSYDRFGTHGLQFKILNMVGDMSSAKLDDISTFKVVTGGDRNIESEVKGGRQFQFRNISKIWYNGNEIPRTAEDDEAFYVRWILINFPNIFPITSDNTIKNLSDIICMNRNEVQGIIQECLNGVRRLYKQGYFRPEIMKNTKHVWRYEAEPIYAFLYDCCEYDSESYIKKKDFRNRFSQYMIMKKKRPYSAKLTTNLLERESVFADRLPAGDREYVYYGIRWKDKKFFDKYRKID